MAVALLWNSVRVVASVPAVAFVPAVVAFVPAAVVFVPPAVAFVLPVVGRRRTGGRAAVAPAVAAEVEGERDKLVGRKDEIRGVVGVPC